MLALLLLLLTAVDGGPSFEPELYLSSGARVELLSERGDGKPLDSRALWNGYWKEKKAFTGFPSVSPSASSFSSLGNFCGNVTTADENPARQDWHLATLKAREAWAFSADAGRPTRGAGAVVCHIDTGYTLHPNVKDGLQGTGYDVRASPVDDDALDEFEQGAGNNHGHGTATASMVVGRHGVAPGAQVFSIRATPTVAIIQGVHRHNVAVAIRYATQRKCEVISMSLGTPFWENDMREAVARAAQAGIIVVAAAGNCTIAVTVPAAYPGVIAVAATNSASKRWKHSNRGVAVAVSAPGDTVWRAQSTSQTLFTDAPSSGTSYATAEVAGAAALWLAHNRDALAKVKPAVIPGLFRLALTQHGVDTPTAWDTSKLGAGILNVEKLLRARFDPNADVSAFALKPKTEQQLLEERYAQLVAETAPPLKKELVALSIRPEETETLAELVFHLESALSDEGQEAALAESQKRAPRPLIPLRDRLRRDASNNLNLELKLSP